MRSDQIILRLGVVFSGCVCASISAHTRYCSSATNFWTIPTTPFIWFTLQGSPGVFWKGFLPDDMNPEGHCRDMSPVAIHCQQQISTSQRCVLCRHWLLSSNNFNLQICSSCVAWFGNARAACDCSWSLVWFLFVGFFRWLVVFFLTAVACNWR